MKENNEEKPLETMSLEDFQKKYLPNFDEKEGMRYVIKDLIAEKNNYFEALNSIREYFGEYEDPCTCPVCTALKILDEKEEKRRNGK